MMKQYFAAIVLLGIFLVVLIPFVSSNPDGLEKVAESLGIEEQDLQWRGLMFDYSVEGFANPYLSTLVAGVLGTILVLGCALILGKILTKKNSIKPKP